MRTRLSKVNGKKSLNISKSNNIKFWVWTNLSMTIDFNSVVHVWQRSGDSKVNSDWIIYTGQFCQFCPTLCSLGFLLYIGSTSSKQFFVDRGPERVIAYWSSGYRK
jgi:hypothetical protein